MFQCFRDIITKLLRDRSGAIKKILRNIIKIIIKKQNENLNRQILMEEIERAVQDMPNGKGSLLHVFIIDFFKACWEIVGGEVVKVVEHSCK